MPRIAQGLKTRGSQFWLQTLVETNDDRLCLPIRTAIGPGAGNITWLSPLANDDMAEYRDAAFIERLGVQADLFRLEDFWPNGGPQWDALARIDEIPIIVEAKSHLQEMASTACGASAKSHSKISRAMIAVQSHLNIASKIDWTGVGYQYANRLAHLYFLRVRNNIPAHLFFIYFANDRTINTPVSIAQWSGAIQFFELLLGTRRHRLSRYVHHLCIDVEAC